MTRDPSPYRLYQSSIMVCAAVQVDVMASWIGQDEQGSAGVNCLMLAIGHGFGGVDRHYYW